MQVALFIKQAKFFRKTSNRDSPITYQNIMKKFNIWKIRDK